MEPGASSVSSRAAGSELKPGIKASIERVEDTVRLHAEALGQHAEAIRATGAEASTCSKSG
jgi:hypothetical protein